VPAGARRRAAPTRWSCLLSERRVCGLSRQDGDRRRWMQEAAADSDARAARRWGIAQQRGRAQRDVGLGLVTDAETHHCAAGALTDRRRGGNGRRLGGALRARRSIAAIGAPTGPGRGPVRTARRRRLIGGGRRSRRSRYRRVPARGPGGGTAGPHSGGAGGRYRRGDRCRRRQIAAGPGRSRARPDATRRWDGAFQGRLGQVGRAPSGPVGAQAVHGGAAGDEHDEGSGDCQPHQRSSSRLLSQEGAAPDSPDGPNRAKVTVSGGPGKPHALRCI